MNEKYPAATSRCLGKRVGGLARGAWRIASALQSWSTPIFLLASLLLLAAQPASAATYTNAATTFSWIDASTHAQVGNGTSPYKFTNTGGCGTTQPVLDDTLSDNIPLGFTFNYGGVDFTQVRIMSNGRLQFNNNLTCGYGSPVTQLPYPNAGLNYTMRIYGNDLDPTAKSEVPAYSTTCLNRTSCYVSYATLGTAPSRQFVVTWNRVPEWTAASTASGSYELQIILQENGEFIYQFGNDTPGPGNVNAQVGWQVNTTDFAVPAVGFPAANSAIRFYIPSALSELRMDEALWSGAGSVVNSSGGSNGAPVGLAQTVAGGKVCRGGDIPANINAATIDAVDTAYDVDSQIGSSGTISFWYKSNVAWNAGGSQHSLLFDASVADNRWFYLVKRSGNGRLSFNLTDNANNDLQVTTANIAVAANTWTHVAVSWNLTAVAASNRLRIYRNGALVQSAAIATTQPLSSAIGTLYMGDNRSASTTNPVTANSANGVLDEVRIYNYEATAAIVLRDYVATRSCSAVDHIQIEHASGSGVTCSPTTLTLKACADPACATLYTGGVSGTLSATTSGTANWEGGTANFTIPASGSVTKTLQLTAVDADVTAVLGATSTAPNPTTCNFGSPTCTFTAYNAGFIFAVPDHIAEVAQPISLSAVRKSDSSLACVPAFASVSKSVTFKCGYTNPASGTLPVRVGGNALNATNSAAASCDAGGQAVSLAFNASGVANTTVQYADVGNMSLTATYSGSGSDAGLSMTGNDAFIAVPKDFAFSSISAAPLIAGKNFSATVSARNNSGAVTPNFGKEATPETVVISFAKNEPTGTSSVDGTLTQSVSAFGVPIVSGGQGPGAALATLAWSEVGKIDLIATLASASYLGSGLSANGSLVGVGAFRPDHFDTVVTQACPAGGFTYSAQPFTVTVTAMNGAAAPLKTQNYDGTVNTAPNYAKALTLSDASVAGVGVLAPSAFVAGEFDRGVATLDTPAYTFTLVKTVPTTIALRAVDADGVSSSGAIEGTAPIRSGRARLLTAYGSELLDLPMSFRTEFWDGRGTPAVADDGWTVNTSDVCTGDTTLGAANAVSLAVAPAGVACVWDSAAPVGGLSGAGCAAAGVAARRFREGATPGVGFAGDFNLWLRPVGVGSVTVTPTVPVWLGVVAPARASFGVYKTPLIYRRENF